MLRASCASALLVVWICAAGMTSDLSLILQQFTLSTAIFDAGLCLPLRLMALNICMSCVNACPLKLTLSVSCFSACHLCFDSSWCCLTQASVRLGRVRLHGPALRLSPTSIHCQHLLHPPLQLNHTDRHHMLAHRSCPLPLLLPQRTLLHLLHTGPHQDPPHHLHPPQYVDHGTSALTLTTLAAMHLMG